MNKIADFLKSHRHIIIWTICYTFVTWAILFFMFKFNIFNGNQWRYLARAHLHGFPGFVFGILILAMIPLYVATSALIIRTKKPLIIIPLPKITLHPEQKNTEPEPETKSEEKTESQLSADIPDEIRHTFLRTRHNIEQFKIYNEKETLTVPLESNTTDINTEQTDNIDSIDSDLPLPTDFDIPFDESALEFSNAPVFTSINFDEPESGTDQSNNKLSEHLSDHNINFKTVDDIIITDTHAIITHDDNDFWATDTDNWFATGKSRPSPIKSVISAATAHNVKPAIYLASTNILDLEILIPQWESDGITVITDLSEI